MDQRWTPMLAEAALSGSLAAIGSAAVLAVAGARTTPSAAAPMNATSQWLWGQKEALDADLPDARHTVLGYVTYHLAASFWAVLLARAVREPTEMREPVPALAAGAATAAVAALVDFKLTPERLTPGFQHRVGKPALVASYAVFALGLAAGTVAMRRLRWGN
ncbi:hypothetical protein ACPWT1_11375 [Ramlibacter sp. MMS24-I3-19]|uniref:hypothetical protein n=1 Tax=Ramlibacter sp. MMS24-I3-19 TaxID=3416606 RepID=UPI003D091877